MEGFFCLNPPFPLEFPIKVHTFPYKFWLLRTLSPSEFPVTLHRVVWIFSGTTHSHLPRTKHTGHLNNTMYLAEGVKIHALPVIFL